MQTEYLDEHKNEFVITKKDNYRTWNNYLGNTEFGLTINNKGLGYNNFNCNPQRQLNALLKDSECQIQPKIILIKDNSTTNIWSTVSFNQDKIDNNYECRHGAGYTVIKSEFNSVISETTYFVPHGEMFEIWYLKLLNRSSNDLNITLSTLKNVQVSLFDEDIDVQCISAPDVEPVTISPIYFFCDKSVGLKADMRGLWKDGFGRKSINREKEDNGSAIQIETKLKSGEIMNFVVFAGSEKEKKRIVEKYGDVKLVENELNKILNNKTCVTNAIRIF